LNRKLFLAMTCTFSIYSTGCYSSVVLKPIQGPSPKANPIMDPRGVFKSGRFYVDLDNASKPFFHEECIGQWNPPTTPRRGAGGNVADPSELAATWNVVYGAGYYGNTVPNAKLCARGSGKSKHGTTVEAEMCQFEEQFNGKLQTKTRGVARDSDNNIYQIN